MDDNKLIKGCKKNDRRSQNALYKKYFPLMTSIALRYGKNEHEALQLVNGGFLKVLLNIKKYSKDYSFATWIRIVLVNHIVDEFRKEKRYITNMHLTEFEEETELVSYNQGEMRLEVKELRDMLNCLPDVSKQVFNLYAIDGYKHKEISEMLGISEGTSKWHVSDARKKLKVLLKKRQLSETKLLTTEI